MERVIEKTIDRTIEKTMEQTPVLPSLSFLVIDTDNKTNEELKAEVYERVVKIFNQSKKKISADLKRNDTIENRAAYKVAVQMYKKEFNKMIRQFNCQIDMLIPII